MERSETVTDFDAQPALGEAGDDWFGDGTAFNSQAELAAALHAMSEAPLAPVQRQSHVPAADTDRAGDVGDDAADGVVSDADVTFELVEHRSPAAPVPRPKAAKPHAESEPSVATWSVRVPGVQLLPQRQPGRTGWSLQNSVRILRQADELVLRLREEAIVTAFSATARALRGGDSAAG